MAERKNVTRNLEPKGPQPCPRCGEPGKRHSTGSRRVIDLNQDVTVRYGKYYCAKCLKYFSVGADKLADKCCRYSRRARAAVLRVARPAGSLEAAQRAVWRQCGLRVPVTTLHDWLALDRRRRLDEASRKLSRAVAS